MCMWSTQLYRPNHSIDCRETSHSFHQSTPGPAVYILLSKKLIVQAALFLTQVIPISCWLTPFRVRWPLGQLDLPSPANNTAPLRSASISSAAPQRQKVPCPANVRPSARRRPGRPVTMMLPAMPAIAAADVFRLFSWNESWE